MSGEMKMEIEKITECNSSGKRYATSVCHHLQGYLQFSSNKKGKGFFSGEYVMISTGEKLGTKITYQDGKNLPVVLNFCPFCGGKLNSIGDD
jgi:hypothetical protein